MKIIALLGAGSLLLAGCTTQPGSDGSVADGIAISTFMVLMAPIAIVQQSGTALVDGAKTRVYAKPGVGLTSYENTIREAEHLGSRTIQWDISDESDGTQKYKVRFGSKIYLGRFKESVAVDYRK